MTHMEEQRIVWRAGPLVVTVATDAKGHPYLHSVRASDNTTVDTTENSFQASESTVVEAPETPYQPVPLTEIGLAGEQNVLRPGTGARAMGSYVGRRLRYVRHFKSESGPTRRLEIESHDEQTGITVLNSFSQYGNASVLRAETRVRNDGITPRVVYAVSALSIGGLSHGSKKWWEEYRIRYANNTWFREAQWVDRSLPDVGLDYTAEDLFGKNCSRAFYDVCSVGSFSSGTRLPIAGLEKTDGQQTWMWSIEHNGGWRWETGQYDQQLYLIAGGPSDTHHRWSKVLAPGQNFASVPVALAVANGPAETAFQALTQYRRLIRRNHSDNEQMSIIFNDYMNCLMGDPTTEKVVALIEPARRAGAEYFCIDCGWYSDDDGWWSTVGEWRESKLRFPEGLRFVTDKIRDAGLKPGLWIEPEVMGIGCPAVDELPPEAYFQRDGQKVVEMDRYQLDFRHPAVIRRMNKVIDRLVADYGVEYFKFDYNIDITSHTDIDCKSPGDGALEHNRAYRHWVESIFERHPSLVIETCSSGGQRLDGALLALHSLQSTSDQQDPLLYAAISVNIPTAVTPEQSASWAYPQVDWSEELIAFTIVNALLGRVHLSGRLDLLSERKSALVIGGMDVYKSIRRDLRTALPFWPLGLAGWKDDWVALGMECADGKTCFLSVWRRWGEHNSCELPVKVMKGRQGTVECLFPRKMESKAEWDGERGVVVVEFPHAPCARLLKITAVSN